MTTPILTREDILARVDSKPRPVNCPELGGRVFVRAMTTGAQFKIGKESNLARENAQAELLAAIVVAGVVGEDGAPILEAADVERIVGGAFPAATLTGLAAEVCLATGGPWGVYGAELREAAKHLLDLIPDSFPPPESHPPLE